MRRLLLTVATLGALALLAAPPAAAHSDVVGGSPGPGAELAPGAGLLRIDFGELEPEAPGYLALYDDQDHPLRVGDASVAGDSICARSEELGPGVYAVAYVVRDADGHRLEGRYEFAVAPGGEAPDPGGCDPDALAAPEEARTIEQATTGGLPGWAPWAVGLVAVAAGGAVVWRVARDRRRGEPLRR